MIGQKMARSIPNCHPDKKYGARGKCVNCYNKWLREINPEYHQRSIKSAVLARKKPNGIRSRDNSLLKKRYGITLEQKETMISDQNNKCKICNKPKELVVEHCHDTKIVLGLTCEKCNILVANLENNMELLPTALIYISTKGKI